MHQPHAGVARPYGGVHLAYGGVHQPYGSVHLAYGGVHRPYGGVRAREPRDTLDAHGVPSGICSGQRKVRR